MTKEEFYATKQAAKSAVYGLEQETPAVIAQLNIATALKAICVLADFYGFDAVANLKPKDNTPMSFVRNDTGEK